MRWGIVIQKNIFQFFFVFFFVCVCVVLLFFLFLFFFSKLFMISIQQSVRSSGMK